MSFRISKKLVSGAALTASLLAAGVALAGGAPAKAAPAPAQAEIAPPTEAAPQQQAEQAALPPGPSMPISAAALSGALVATNNGEIQQAVIALTHSINPVVIAYAQRMIQDHARANRQVLDLDASAGLRAEASSVSRQLDAESMTQNAVLLQLFGPAFDVVYLDGQIRAHAEALRLVENHVGPMATLPAFATMLSQARGMIEQHLDLAIVLRRQLGL